jgi:hypothetical protein
MQQAEDLASSIKALDDGTNILPSWPRWMIQ